MVVSIKTNQIRTVREYMHSIVLMCILLIASNAVANASSRIKDIATFEGVRENMLVGYGPVSH